MTTEEYLEKRKSENWKFNKVVSDDAFMSVNRIHPTKQKCVKEIVDAARKDDAVRKIIIFGSSIRYDCDFTSDLDICIDWNRDCYDEEGVLRPFTANMRKVISNATHGNADVINHAYLGDTLLEESVKKGVTVYEHDV